MTNYNLTNFTTSDNILGMYTAVNSASENVLSYLLVITVFVVVLFAMLRNNPPQESFAAASTVLAAVSLMFLLAGIINVVWVVGATIIWAASIVALSKA